LNLLLLSFAFKKVSLSAHFLLDFKKVFPWNSLILKSKKRVRPLWSSFVSKKVLFWTNIKIYYTVYKIYWEFTTFIEFVSTLELKVRRHISLKVSLYLIFQLLKLLKRLVFRASSYLIKKVLREKKI
jgi:hypothetical protein